MLYPIALLLFATASTFAQSTTSSSSSDSLIVLSGSRSRSISNDVVSGTPTYQSITTTVSYTTSSSSTSSSNGTMTGASNSTSSNPFPTRLVGTKVANGTMTGTSTSAAPTNTQPCNGWVEFCDREYSNVTYIAAHNSPFTIPNNAASNQDFGIFAQLNDGIRMLQGQTHLYNGELRFCHTSCELLDAGSLEEYLRNATEWVAAHPFDVVTILLGNSDLLNVTQYVDPVQASGITDYLYEPPKNPMALHDWPKLSSLILNNKRVVLFMDYNANQTEVPYIIDEFAQIWETPFSPTNNTFPCYQQRPPDLSDLDAGNRMYMANHNLNVDIELGSVSLLVPNSVEIDNTNANGLSEVGMAGRTIDNCTTKWNRAPNFLLVDFYNRGNFNGSVFAAAAAANGVEYNPDNCCGKNENVNAGSLDRPSIAVMLAGLVVALAYLV